MMDKKGKEPGPLNDGFAKQQKRAGIEQAAMKDFFDRLSGRQRRIMRRAQYRTTGQREAWGDMMKRIAARENAR